MKNEVSWIVAILLVANCVAYPVWEEEEPDPEEFGGNFEGDMILDNVQMMVIDYPYLRSVLVNTSSRWPSNVIHYEIDSVFEKQYVDFILQAMHRMESETCLRFLPKTNNTKDYIHVTAKNTGCNSKVGYRGGEQVVNLKKSPLGKGCFRMGTIIHEILHSLGFRHQHSVENRDEFVDIFMENVKDHRKRGFKKYPADVVSNMGFAYDYDSVMHYRARAFSKNGKETILPKDRKARIGQRLRLSEVDIKKINLVYNCSQESDNVIEENTLVK